VTEDTFRIVVAAAVALACIAFVVQAVATFAVYRVARKIQRKVEPLADQAEPVIGKFGPMIDKIGLAADNLAPAADSIGVAAGKVGFAAGRIGLAVDRAGPVIDGIGVVADKVAPVVDEVGMVLANTNRIVEDTRPRIAELSGEAVEIAKSARQQVERIGELLHDAGDRARTRLEQIDQTVESTVEQLGQVGDAMKRAALRPVREVNGLAAGISAAVSTLVHHSRKPSVDQATQDEEMFI
jgi:methyl-accepting chemotaxis protein